MGDDNQKPKIDILKYFFKYIVPILERKWMVLILFLVTFLIALPLGFLIKPMYESEGMLQMFRPYSQVSATGDKIEPLPAPPAYVIKEVELLQSNSFIGEVLNAIPENDKPGLEYPLAPHAQIVHRIKEFIKSTVGEWRINKIKKLLGKEVLSPTEDMIRKSQIKQIRDRVTIRKQTRTAMVWITANSFRNDFAATLVRTYIDIWQAANTEDNKREINNKISFLKGQRANAYRDFQNAKNELIQFKKQEEIPPNVSLISNMDIQLRLEQLQMNFDMMKERYLMLDQKLIDTQLKAKGIVDNIKMLNPPEIPIKPSKNKTRIFQLALAMTGLFVGIGLTLGLDILKNLIRYESDITGAVDMPVIARLPKL